MKTRRPLRNVNTRTGGTASRSRRARSQGTPRAGLARTLAVPALVFVSFGATAAVYANRAVPAQETAAAVCNAAKASHMPWMYAKPNHMPWMYAKPSYMPWMYGTKAGPASATRACHRTSRQAT
jgi:hypothetical protein